MELEKSNILQSDKNNTPDRALLYKSQETSNNDECSICKALSQNPGMNCDNMYENSACYPFSSNISEKKCYDLPVGKSLNENKKRKMDPIPAPPVPFIPGRIVTARFAEAITFRVNNPYIYRQADYNIINNELASTASPF